MPFLPRASILRGRKFTVFCILLINTCISRENAFCNTNSRAAGDFIINEHALSIHQKTMQLKMKEAAEDLHAIRLAEPGNKIYDFLESYTWFFSLFIMEEEAQYKKGLARKKKLLENIRQGNPDSPYYLFCQAEILLQWATIHLKFNDKTKAAYDVYEAYNMLLENKKKFPNFHENNKSLSIIHTLAQSLPSWVQKLSGIKGSVSQGTKEIEYLVNNLPSYPLFRQEILAIYAYILFYTRHEKEKAYDVIKKYKMADPKSPLLIYLTASITQKTGRNDEAIQILESRQKLPGQIPFYYLDFIYGKYKLYRLDKNADHFMLNFVQNFKGRHYIKEAYQKLYWYELLTGGSTYQRNYYLNKVISEGNSLLDEDIQAFSECKSSIPNVVLLKSRLLYDGGYYQRSKKLLTESDLKAFSSPDIEEYHYRLARNMDALTNTKEAIQHYKKTIAVHQGKKYFACSAALQLGLLYEKEKNYGQAKLYFKKCLGLHPEGYSTSLHQKAKVALARMQSG